MNTITPVAHYGDKKIKLGDKVDGKPLGYEDIDRSKLSAFSLLDEDDRTIIKLHLSGSRRLIWRKRCYLIPGGGKRTIHILGWQDTINGKNVQSIAYVFESGRIELAGEFREGHPIFDNIKLLDSEK